MVIVLAPDSFKGTLTQLEASAAMARGIRAVWPDAPLLECPMADGGEGTADVIALKRGGRFHECEVDDAYGRPRKGRWLELPDGSALIEASAGPGFIRPDDRPAPGARAHSRGLGQLMRRAIEQGARRLVVTLGGTGSSDGGLGALLELGAEISGVTEPGADALDAVSAVRLPGFDTDLEIWSDVLPPLTGPRGAVRRYGPQKGLGPEDVAGLDAAMARYGALLDGAAGRPVSRKPGAGAAGGLGAALLALGGRVVPGGVAVARAVGLLASLSNAAAVVTGEGAVDVQSGEGKAVGVVARLARELDVPVLVVGGRLEPAASALYGLGAGALFGLTSGFSRGAEPPGAGVHQWAERRLAERMRDVVAWVDPKRAPRYRISGR